MPKQHVALCECGCGLPAPIATQTRTKRGHIKGQPMRFRRGHGGLRRSDNYTVDADTGCWVWQGKLVRGYAYTYVKGNAVRAHRFYYEREHGPIPAGLVLDHLCRNPSCVNPEHLEPVTHLENVRRQRSTKLSKSDVERILRIGRSETLHAIADRFGVSPVTVQNILTGATWKDVAPEIPRTKARRGMQRIQELRS